MKMMRVHVSVTTDDPGSLSRAIEVLARACSGLALEEIDTWMSVSTDDDDDEEDDACVPLLGGEGQG